MPWSKAGAFLIARQPPLSIIDLGSFICALYAVVSQSIFVCAGLVKLALGFPFLAFPAALLFYTFADAMGFFIGKVFPRHFSGGSVSLAATLVRSFICAFYAVVTSLLNLLEANVFFIIVPEEYWLLAITVGLRTLIFLLLAIEFLFMLQHHWLTPTVRKVRRWSLIGLTGLLVLGIVPAGARFFQAYYDVRHQLSPYQGTINALQSAVSSTAETGTRTPALILNSYDHQTYDWLYPYLRRDFAFYMLDDYAPPGESMEARTVACLERIAAAQHDWWLFDNDPGVESPSEAVAADWLTVHGTLVDVRDIDGGRLYHFVIQ